MMPSSRFFLWSSVLIVFNMSCNTPIREPGLVSIERKDRYYDVNIDYTTKASRKQIGSELGKQILHIFPGYPTQIDSYLKIIFSSFKNMAAQMLETTYHINNIDYKKLDDLTNQSVDEMVQAMNIPQDYRDEIDGLSEVIGQIKDFSFSHSRALLVNFSQEIFNKVLLTKIISEYLKLEKEISKTHPNSSSFLLPTIKEGACSAIAFFQQGSQTKNTVVGRVLDWTHDSQSLFAKLHSVTTFHYSEGEKITSIGALGHLGAISFIKDHIFASILLANTETQPGQSVKNSFAFDLRQAMEQPTPSIQNIARHMANPQNDYFDSCLIFIADQETAEVFENNLLRTTTGARRALRSSTSELNPGVTWPYPFAIASVNSPALKGNTNLYAHPNEGKRWDSYLNEISVLGTKPATMNDIKGIISYKPSSVIIDKKKTYPQSAGNIYNNGTVQMMTFEPETRTLEVFFVQDETMATPVFEPIPLD